MIHDPRTGRARPDLAEELFGFVEDAQGRAFISDGVGVLSRVELLRLARESIEHSKRAINGCQAFIDKHKGLTRLPSREDPSK